MNEVNNPKWNIKKKMYLHYFAYVKVNMLQISATELYVTKYNFYEKLI